MESGSRVQTGEMREQLAWRPPDGGFSAAEALEHLGVTAGQIRRLVDAPGFP